MKILFRGRSVTLGLALIAAGLAAPPLVSASAAPAPKPDPNAVEAIRAAASGDVAVRANPATGQVGFVRTKARRGDLLPSVTADTRGEAAAKADRYVDDYAAAAFRTPPGQLERAADDVAADRTGWTFTYTQDYRGVPVFGAELKAHVDRAGHLTSVNGFTAPDISLDTTPAVSRSRAAERALAMVKAQPAGYEPGTAPSYMGGLEVVSNELMVYRTGSTRGVKGEERLAWVLEVSNEATVRETIILDAITNKPLNRWTMITDALDRELYEASLDDNGTPDDPSDDTVAGLDEPVWTEGDPFPGDLDQDQQNEVLATAETYWLFKNTFSRDSWDGTGGKMITVNNDPRIDCPNANWNGVTTNYCSGVTGDDTVAHEWGHAYTEATSGLVYQWQSGAMNEAYSDIWGETVDMLNGRHNELGEDGHAGGAVLREEGKCSTHQPAAYELDVTIDAPAEIAGPCAAAPAAFGPEITGTQTVDVVVALDEDTDGDANDPIANDTTTNGCGTYDNAAEAEGSWVLVDRGFCTFAEKIAMAEDMGAIGLIIGDNRPEVPFPVSGTGDIPGFMVDQASATRIKSVPGPVTMTIERVVDPRATDETYRWLSGENDPAFGGAIRDMWNPTCLGDPGKVSDQEYACSGDDHGGVHTNSGVVNRTYAILVDGLPGKVDAIGLDKAAWLFWYSQFHYLTPTSTFSDLADALESSCAELTNRPIEKLTIGNPTAPDGSDGGAVADVIPDGMTASDCAAVVDAVAETELRKDPNETCNWQPLLQPGAPALECGAGTVSEVAFSEDFEDGLTGWSQDEVMVNADTETFGWETVEDAHGHEGTAAFSADPETSGSCDGGPDDLTSRTGLISPDITVPDGLTPRMSFDHYVATENEYDGANVKVSVNGGDFEVIPANAYLFNAPTGTIANDQGGPMAGEIAWTGTDGGKSEGSWGTSVVDLSAVAEAGDTVQFRFDLGRDGCNGVDGWYVDNVVVESCVEKVGALPTKTEVVWVKPNPVKKGNAFRVRVEVSADETPAGVVRIMKGKAVLARGSLGPRGVAVITVKRILGVGRHNLTATYLGNGSFEPSKDAFRVRVVR